MVIIDFHAHILPDRWATILPHIAKGPLAPILSPERVEMIRRNARIGMGPVASFMHKAQTVLRHLPDPARRKLDQVAGLAPLPGLFIESTPADLKEAMDQAGIHYTVVIAAPPIASNEFILDTCATDPRLIPVVNIPSGTARPGQKLRKYVERGARMLKIHPAADGEGVDSPRYNTLLKVADELGIPVIIHTGCVHSHLLYKDPEQGHAQRYVPWFKEYPNTKFILAHMNFHEPNVALDLCEEYPNLVVDTSWQPPEVIGEAVRRIGAERVLFGTDWPIVGHNLTLGISRVRDCVETGTLKSSEADLILGGNAAKLLGLSEDAAPV